MKQRHSTFSSLIKTACALALGGLVWYLFSEQDVFARWEHWQRETSPTVQAFDALFLGAFFATNLTVLFFAWKPAGALYFMKNSATRKKLMQDMVHEQENMPDLYATLRRALAHPEQAQAIRRLAIFYALLFLIPAWWIYWAQRHISRLLIDGCSATSLRLAEFPLLDLLQPELHCQQSGRVWGNVVGGVLLFLSAVFFRSRLQIALWGFSRFQKRSAPRSKAGSQKIAVKRKKKAASAA